ncbi:hypothetical protein [Pedobacter frigoris]|uniref:Uncharacterized protein n=1 Tax=Pedobacter frigoris TaxID=2571272 RepID=A0A4U1CT74_9SPHI|nr:hypothetical protein [Pedobacter frigoris]TKC08928.1 hypothetical protein FA047_02195 [Pedobacter frigoris]
MKTNLKNLLRISLSLCLLIVISINTNAQEGKKLIKKKKVDTTEGKIKPIITSPVAGSTVDGPFVLVGKAEPNTTVNVIVSPIYQLPKSTTGKTVLRVSTPLHEPQQFTAKADANGVWQSRLVEVQYDPKATNKRIFASVNQIWGSKVIQSGNTEYFASPKLTMIVGTIKVPAKPKEEEKSSGQPETDEGIVKGGSVMPFQISSPKNNRYVAHDDFSIAGVAAPGATVRVEVRYFGYRSKSNVTIRNYGPAFLPGVDKNTTVVNDALWTTFTVRSNGGIWGTGYIEFIKKIDGYSCWANTYTITASLVNENGKLVRPVKVNVTRMKTKAI